MDIEVEIEENTQLIIPAPDHGRTPVVHAPEWAPFDIEATVRAWLSSEVANGDPREDTVSSYKSNLAPCVRIDVASPPNFCANLWGKRERDHGHQIFRRIQVEHYCQASAAA